MAKAKKKTGTKPALAAPDLLVEIGTEELPPKALKNLGEALAHELYLALDDLQLTSPEGEAEKASAHYHVYSAPRRLAVLMPAIRTQQPTREIERRGPALAASYDREGKPTAAALGFAKSCGVALEKLDRLETDKGSWLVFRKKEKGQPGAKLIPGAIEQALKKLPIPKRMRWGNLDAEFIRPVHWLVALHGERVVPCTILAQRAGADTYGHRFLKPQALRLKRPADYATTLEKKGFVLPDFDARRAAIQAEVDRLAKKLGGKADTDNVDLLDEVTALVEWPHALAGAFDRTFLEVPPEVLVSSMRDHQRYFHVVDAKGRLLPHFISVANIAPKNDKQVREGNERVLRARLSDARFFWESDRKVRLEGRVEGLKTVVFQERLGSVYDKTERVGQLAGEIATRMNIDPELARRAARLAKADLLSGMVGEFPELQGVMGRYYARHDGEAAEVADAIEEQYRPRYAGDAVARTGTGQALAIADKLDTLVGIFGINEGPTGDRAPFGLRRAALGVLRTLIDSRLDLDLRALLDQAVTAYSGKFAPAVAQTVFDFILERLRHYYLQPPEGAREQFLPDEVEAVLALKPGSPYDAQRRLVALRDFRRLREAESLAAANKRIRNILRQANGVPFAPLDAQLLRDDAEKKLAEQVTALAAQVSPLFAAGDYAGALKHLAALRSNVDEFFDKVMVMTEDPAVRGNRLALLTSLSDLFLRVADISKLQTRGEA
jgi:glycyl-tRNA synthetase beta chain